MRRSMMILAFLVGAAGAGCYTDYAYSPGLVYVSPTVGVVVDATYPTFYSSNYFWLYDRGSWYRSSYANGGWVLAVPPPDVASIPAPWAYARYHPYGPYRYYNGHRIYYGQAY